MRALVLTARGNREAHQVAQMRAVGNARAAEIYEARMSSSDRPSAGAPSRYARSVRPLSADAPLTSSRHSVLEKFVRKKYEEKAWAKLDSEAPVRSQLPPTVPPQQASPHKVRL